MNELKVGDVVRIDAFWGTGHGVILARHSNGAYIQKGNNAYVSWYLDFEMTLETNPTTIHNVKIMNGPNYYEMR